MLITDVLARYSVELILRSPECVFSPLLCRGLFKPRQAEPTKSRWPHSRGSQSDAEVRRKTGRRRATAKVRRRRLSRLPLGQSSPSAEEALWAGFVEEASLAGPLGEGGGGGGAWSSRRGVRRGGHTGPWAWPLPAGDRPHGPVQTGLPPGPSLRPGPPASGVQPPARPPRRSHGSAEVPAGGAAPAAGARPGSRLAAPPAPLPPPPRSPTPAPAPAATPRPRSRLAAPAAAPPSPLRLPQRPRPAPPPPASAGRAPPAESAVSTESFTGTASSFVA
ncbi:uncharacterized protein [Equus asinus]|uniref:uncharacterized protein n=1 Tax=Equus asinus TaxID=9793 RepID=UPI0038F7557A